LRAISDLEKTPILTMHPRFTLIFGVHVGVSAALHPRFSSSLSDRFCEPDRFSDAIR
jgi:hypothetical protein